MEVVYVDLLRLACSAVCIAHEACTGCRLLMCSGNRSNSMASSDRWQMCSEWHPSSANAFQEHLCTTPKVMQTGSGPTVCIELVWIDAERRWKVHAEAFALLQARLRYWQALSLQTGLCTVT